MFDKFNKLFDAILLEILDPIVLLLFVGAMIFFLWGLVEFIWNTNDSTAKETGKKHMIYGVVGLFVMAAAQGIVAIIQGTLGR